MRASIQPWTDVLSQPVDLEVNEMLGGNDFSRTNLYMVDGFKPVRQQTSLMR